MFGFGWNGLQHLIFLDASFQLTLCWLDSMASSRSRLRLCFSVRGRGEEFDWDEEDDEDFDGLLEKSLSSPLPASLKLGKQPALHILNDTLHKGTNTQNHSRYVKVGCWYRELANNLATHEISFICDDS